jgi:hypothetical protein
MSIASLGRGGGGAPAACGPSRILCEYTAPSLHSLQRKSCHWWWQGARCGMPTKNTLRSSMYFSTPLCDKSVPRQTISPLNCKSFSFSGINRHSQFLFVILDLVKRAVASRPCQKDRVCTLVYFNLLPLFLCPVTDGPFIISWFRLHPTSRGTTAARPHKTIRNILDSPVRS